MCEPAATSSLTLEFFRDLFQNLGQVKKHSVHLFNFNPNPKSDKQAPIYSYMDVSINAEAWKDLTKDITSYYISKEGQLKWFNKVQAYTGTSDKRSLCTIDKTNEAIIASYDAFCETFSKPVDPGDPYEYTDAYGIRFKYTVGQGAAASTHNVFLISVRPPVVNLDRVYIWEKKTKELALCPHNRVLSFGAIMDIIIVDSTICLLTSKGEHFFNLEFAHKVTCKKHLARIKSHDLIQDFGTFEQRALLKKNMSKFVTFDEDCLADCIRQDNDAVAFLAAELEIECINAKQFAPAKPAEHDKLIDMLCHRATINPYDKYKKRNEQAPPAAPEPVPPTEPPLVIPAKKQTVIPIKKHSPPKNSSKQSTVAGFSPPQKMKQWKRRKNSKQI